MTLSSSAQAPEHLLEVEITGFLFASTFATQSSVLKSFPGESKGEDTFASNECFIYFWAIFHPSSCKHGVLQGMHSNKCFKIPHI